MLTADHTLLVFIPQLQPFGYFYNFISCDLFSFDLSDTIFNDLAHHTWSTVHGQPLIGSLTFPIGISSNQNANNSISSSPRRSYRENQEEVFESVTGQQYAALKYIVVPQIEEGRLVIIECGWDQIRGVSHMHQNDFMVEKIENQVRGIVQNEVGKIAKEVKVFGRNVGRKWAERLREGWTRRAFNQWKRMSYIPILLSQNLKDLTPTQQHIVEEPYAQNFKNIRASTDKKRRYNSVSSAQEDKSPQFRHTRGRSITNHAFSPASGSRGSNSKIKIHQQNPYHRRSISQGNTATAAVHRSNSRSRSASKFSAEEEYNNIAAVNEEAMISELEVEKAAKRKLVSSALIMISVQQKLQRGLELKQAFNEWKSFQSATVIAESAFNKLLEINHKHSKARYETAVHIMNRVAKKSYARQFLTSLLNNNATGPSLYGHYDIESSKKRSLSQSPGTPNRQYYQQRLGAFSGSSTHGSNQLNLNAPRDTLLKTQSPPQAETPMLGHNRYQANETQEFEDEVFGMQDDGYNMRQSLQPVQKTNDQYKRRSISSERRFGGVHTQRMSEEVESEFSLGTAQGTKGLNRIYINQQEPIKSILVQENAEPINLQHRSLKPKPLQQNYVFQNMFKRL